MARSSPPPAGVCLPTPNGDLPGRCVRGGVTGTVGSGAGLPPAGRRCPERCTEPEPTGHGGVRPGHERSSVGGRARRDAADRCDVRAAERLRRERDAERRARLVAARRTHGPDLVDQAPSADCRHRHCLRSLGPKRASTDVRAAQRRPLPERQRPGGPQPRDELPRLRQDEARTSPRRRCGGSAARWRSRCACRNPATRKRASAPGWQRT